MWREEVLSWRGETPSFSGTGPIPSTMVSVAPFGIIFGSFVCVSLPMRLATCFGHYAGSWKLGLEDGTARGLRMQMGRKA